MNSINVGEVAAGIEFALGLCKEVYGLVQSAKSNKARCQEIYERVCTLEKMVLCIKQRPETATPEVRAALFHLTQSLSEATQLMSKASRANAVASIFKSGSTQSKFEGISWKLNGDLQLLSVALQISHGDAIREGPKSSVTEHPEGAAPLEPAVAGSSRAELFANAPPYHPAPFSMFHLYQPPTSLLSPTDIEDGIKLFNFYSAVGQGQVSPWATRPVLRNSFF